MPATSTSDRRGFPRGAAIALTATQLGPIISAHAQSLTTPTPNSKDPERDVHECIVRSPAPATLAAQTEDTAVRPFSINTPDEALVDLRARTDATRWPDRETVTDDSQGVQLATIQSLVQYWGTEYDWRTCEARLNALPQFMTEIDGLDIHFVHVRSDRDDSFTFAQIVTMRCH